MAEAALAATTNTPASALVASHATSRRFERLSAQSATREGMNGRPKRSSGPTSSRSIDPKSALPAIPQHDAERDERAGVGAGDQAERAAVEVDDPDHADDDRHDHVDDRHGEEALRALLDAVEARAGLVEQRDEQAEAGDEPEPVVAVAEEDAARRAASRARRRPPGRCRQRRRTRSPCARRRSARRPRARRRSGRAR